MSEIKPLKILTINNPDELKILRTKSELIPVDEITSPEIQDLIDRMFATLKLEKYGVGLAAPQVGKNIRMFIAQSKDTGRGGEKILSVFINPEVSIEDFTQSIEVEGCLSVPDVWEKVPRYIGVRVRYYNRDGERIVAKFYDFIAQLIQHENDHLDGVLFIDKIAK